MKTYQLKELETGKLINWTLAELLQEINRDRSKDWQNYNTADWQEGWCEWCEGDIYTLIPTPC